jgi:3-hydroxybutyryl-CoA dehydrogenase
MIRTQLEADYRIGVVGAGTMGRGIAQVAAQAGFRVSMIDVKPGLAEQARGFIDKMLGRSVDKGKLQASEREAILARIEIGTELTALTGSDLVIEAVIEDLELKRRIFAELEEVCGADAVLVSNTSALPIAAIGARCAHRERLAGMHFMNPVPLMKLVEVISTPFTAPEVVAVLLAVAERMNKSPIRVQDFPAFLAGNCARGFYTEALRFNQESIAPPAVIDRIVREAGGFRMGPFQVMDLVGLDVNYPASKSLFEDAFFDPRYRLTPQYRLLTEAGMLGRKTGAGFYRYDADGNAVIEAEAAVTGGLPAAVWLWAHDTATLERLQAVCTVAGVNIDSSERPPAGMLCLVAPIGEDATATAAHLGLDPARTVAVDTLYGWDRLRTVMSPPGADEAAMAAAMALLGADGTGVARINDSPGFIMPRLQANITNLACDLCQQGVSTPGDVDLGMRMGFNFPEGPLAAGDRLGSGVMLKLILALYEFYGDDRYRPSPWLRRREMLGLSLSTPERVPAAT